MTNKLKQQFEKVVDAYIEEFCKKQEIDMIFKDAENWVIKDKGGIIDICDMFLSFDDIRLDIDQEAPKGLIIEWYWANDYEKQSINYYSYIKGLRHKDLE